MKCIDNKIERLKILGREIEKRLYSINYRKYFKDCLKIRNKESNIVPFIANEGQGKLIDVIENWKKDNPDPRTRKTLYIIILKARQIGYSTATEGVFFHDISTDKNKIALVVSFDEDSAKNINDMSNRYYQYLPQDMKPLSRPSRSKGLLLENPKFAPSKPINSNNDPGLQSKFLIDTARNENAGSSYTINFLHLSEIAKWPGDIQVTMTSLLQAVPQFNSIVIVESTAKGYNFFKDLWDAAVAGENDYVPIFMAWWEHPEYRLPYTGFELTSEEKELKQTYNLDLEQLTWRKWAIKNKCSGSKDQFKQEYPSSPEEAFLATGIPVYFREKIIIRKRQLEKAYLVDKPKKGRFVYEYKNQMIVDETIEFIEDPEGWITIYEDPKQGYPYVLGGDIAEGGIDFTASHIINNITGNQAAVFHFHTDTDTYAKEMYCLGKYYNTALIAIEMNFDLHPIKELDRLKYPLQYQRETVDSHTNKLMKKDGFMTTKVTRPVIIANTVSLVRDEIQLINDIPTLDEMLTFVRDENGKPAAEAGKYDDLVLAYAIGHYSRSQQSMEIKRPKQQLKGYFTETELEDMGYSKSEIKRLLKGMKSWKA